MDGGILDLGHDLLKLLTDLGGIGDNQLGELFQPGVHGGAQLPHAVLQLGPDGVALGIEDRGDVAQLLVGSVAGLREVGLNLLPDSICVLGGAGMNLPHVSGHGPERKDKPIQFHFDEKRVRFERRV